MGRIEDLRAELEAQLAHLDAAAAYEQALATYEADTSNEAAKEAYHQAALEVDAKRNEANALRAANNETMVTPDSLGAEGSVHPPDVGV